MLTCKAQHSMPRADSMYKSCAQAAVAAAEHESAAWEEIKHQANLPIMLYLR